MYVNSPYWHAGSIRFIDMFYRIKQPPREMPDIISERMVKAEWARHFVRCAGLTKSEIAYTATRVEAGLS